MRKEYLNTVTGEVITERVLEARGAPMDNLPAIGIFLLKHPEPEYDKVVEQLELSPERVKEGDVYVQPYIAVELPAEVQQRNLDSLAKERADEARAAADQATAPYLSDFSSVEKMTFEQQRLEVEAYKKNPDTPTPTLDALAAQRGIARDEQIRKAIAKVDAFSKLSERVVGKQQGYEDAIKRIVAETAKSVRERANELRALVFDFSA